MKLRDPSPKTDPQGTATWIRGQSKSLIEWTRRSVPMALRPVLGLLLIGGSVLGFLPNSWLLMIPLGILGKLLAFLKGTWAFRGTQFWPIDRRCRNTEFPTQSSNRSNTAVTFGVRYKFQKNPWACISCPGFSFSAVRFYTDTGSGTTNVATSSVAKLSAIGQDVPSNAQTS